jgi:uncharacterized protein YfaP (DUF2135 family)
MPGDSSGQIRMPLEFQLDFLPFFPAIGTSDPRLQHYSTVQTKTTEARLGRVGGEGKMCVEMPQLLCVPDGNHLFLVSSLLSSGNNKQ